MTKTNNFDRKELRKFHILDFPEKEITVRLKNNFYNKLKHEIKQNGGFNKIGKFCSIKSATIFRAIKKREIPLYVLKKLRKLFKLRAVEKNISAYRAFGGRTWINKPKLPIRESPELIEILGHMLGDGHINLNKKKTSNYTNTAKELINHFSYLINRVFGQVNPTIHEDKRFKAWSVSLPRPIPVVLSNFYPEILKNEFSHRLFELPNEFAHSFIRSFADDESCVTTSSIIYTQKNKRVLENIMRLHYKVGFDPKTIIPVKKKKNVHISGVKGRGLSFFKENIDFKHFEKKRLLESEITRKENPRKKIGPRDITKKEITKHLDKPKTSKELAEIIGVQPSIIRIHLKSLQNEGYVKISSYKAYKTPSWARIKKYELINDRRKKAILNYLNLPMSTREISLKLNFSKDSTLNLLNELKKNNKIEYIVNGKTFIWRRK